MKLTNLLSEVQTLRTALQNSLSKAEPGSKLDKSIKNHNRAVKLGLTDSPDIRKYAPDGYHIDKKGLIKLGELNAN
jgi:hypothetical protein